MKRKRNLYDKIYDLNNITNMYHVVRGTTKNKKEVLKYELNLNSNLINVSNKLYKREYTLSKYRIFLVREPKYRLIMSESIEDKTVNHLVSRHILGVLDLGLIDQNVATRKDKGSSYAYNLLLKYINKLQMENENIYVLKLDISKYFYNIDHEILKEKLAKKIKDKDALNILFDIIDSTNEAYINKSIDEVREKERVFIAKSKLPNKDKLYEELDNIPYYVKGKGLPIGNMTSQFMAVFYLSDVDHYIKEVLKHKYYIRYMDDLIILDSDKRRLIDSFYKIKKEIEKENLNINKKSKIYNLKNGFSFLGYNFKFNKKLLIRFNNKTIRRIERDLKHKKEDNYNLYYKSIRSYKGYFSKSNSNLKNKFLVVEENMYGKYFNLKMENKQRCVFIKSGLFYYTFDEDALIMSYLFDYKVINGRVGFPIAVFENKVLKHLNYKNISVLVLEGNEVKLYDAEENDYVNCLGHAFDHHEMIVNVNRLCDMAEDIIKTDFKYYESIKMYLDSLSGAGAYEK